MDIPEAQEAALQIVLQDEKIRLKIPSQTEKEIRTMPWLRSIRLDVFSVDQNKVVYNTEMQAERKSDLVKRSRYYQGLIDSSLLEPGCISFNQLNDAYVIMIMPAADSERIRMIHEYVKRIKSSEEMGVKYMQAWEEKIMEREKGEDLLAQLISRLIMEGRNEDVKAVAEDKEFRKQLYQEYGFLE